MATSIPKTVPRAVPKSGPGIVPTVALEPPPEPPRKSRMKRYLMLVVVAAVLGGSAFAAWSYFKPAAHPDQAAHEAAKPPVFIVVEPFTVNLTPGDAGDQYLQIALTVQVADQAQVERIKLYMPQVRSRILMLLSSKKASEISSVEGKKKLSDDIIAQLKLPFAPQSAPQVVSDVFFTSFVIQ